MSDSQSSLMRGAVSTLSARRGAASFQVQVAVVISFRPYQCPCGTTPIAISATRAVASAKAQTSRPEPVGLAW